MTNCDTYRRRLGAYLDGEVLLPERVAIEAHLAECAACQTRRSELAGADTFLAQAPEPTWSPGSTDALIAKLRRELGREQAAAVPARASVPEAHVLSGLRGFWGGWRGAAVLAVVCAVILIPGMNPTRRGAVFQRAAEHELAKAAAPAAAPAAHEPALVLADARSNAGKSLTEAKPAPALEGSRTGEGFAKTDPVSLASLPKGAKTPVVTSGALAGVPAASPAALLAVAPAASVAPGAKNAALAALEAEVDAVDARLATVEKSVATFTTAARETATRESQMVASRRFAEWR